MDNDTVHGIFALEHRSGGEVHIVTCSQCGVPLPFKMSYRPGRTLKFVQPHDCEVEEAPR
jgi:hypothetical protein